MQHITTDERFFFPFFYERKLVKTYIQQISLLVMRYFGYQDEHVFVKHVFEIFLDM